MSSVIRPATAADVPTLVTLMMEFYAEADFPLPEGPATRAFQTLLREPDFGVVLVADLDGVAAGHVVLTLCFSMEYGGMRGFIDDLYVRRKVRGQGTGAALLAAARDAAIARGVRALHVEVGPDNHVARRLYVRSGYVDSGHLLLSQPLEAPVHAS